MKKGREETERREEKGGVGWEGGEGEEWEVESEEGAKK